ncbi:GtrA family protein [Alcaligenes endophyticus]|uniref:GtrA family protein n=1 Tax=Alcaligenes endophyticus TaxID=1929088 RepID=A0ABT8EGT7_9BURK|nr:GtrA family protein [Alcaligenes endophyticus]MCX5589846.1 GtrA family protein [Alcaligenes endophyticus]MDN4120491.1 GtrA family protein [Alcaligenes endophyticus]
MPRQLFFFILIGSLAAGVHWGAVVLLVSHAHVPPLWANLIGWLAAFTVSFGGHYTLTFTQHSIPFLTALRRFFLVSALGFGVNESAYAVLLHYSSLSYQYLLAVVLVAMAFVTFVLSRVWAFAHK